MECRHCGNVIHQADTGVWHNALGGRVCGISASHQPKEPQENWRYWQCRRCKFINTTKVQAPCSCGGCGAPSSDGPQEVTVTTKRVKPTPLLDQLSARSTREEVISLYLKGYYPFCNTTPLFKVVLPGFVSDIVLRALSVELLNLLDELS